MKRDEIESFAFLFLLVIIIAISLQDKKEDNINYLTSKYNYSQEILAYDFEDDQDNYFFQNNEKTKMIKSEIQQGVVKKEFDDITFYLMNKDMGHVAYISLLNTSSKPLEIKYKTDKIAQYQLLDNKGNLIYEEFEYGNDIHLDKGGMKVLTADFRPYFTKGDNKYVLVVTSLHEGANDDFKLYLPIHGKFNKPVQKNKIISYKEDYKKKFQEQNNFINKGTNTKPNINNIDKQNNKPNPEVNLKPEKVEVIPEQPGESIGNIPEDTEHNKNVFDEIIEDIKYLNIDTFIDKEKKERIINIKQNISENINEEETNHIDQIDINDYTIFYIYDLKHIKTTSLNIGENILDLNDGKSYITLIKKDNTKEFFQLLKNKNNHKNFIENKNIFIVK